MSERENIQLTWNELIANASGSDEWRESLRGGLQLAEEEAKTGKFQDTDIKWEDKEKYKLLIFPNKTKDGKENDGISKKYYKAFFKVDGKLRSCRHDTLEEVENDDLYKSRDDPDSDNKEEQPKPRWCFEVNEIIPETGELLFGTYSLARTHYQHVAQNYLLEDSGIRAYKVKPGKNNMDAPTFKQISESELKALINKKK